jgi:hypothetical protein
MNIEFPDVCKELIEEASHRIIIETQLKHEAVRNCEVERVKYQSEFQSKLSAVFLSGMHRVMQDE